MSDPSASQKDPGVDPFLVRPATPDDVPAVSEMCHALWPESSAPDHAAELVPLLAGAASGSLPSKIFLAEGPDRSPIGFVHVGLRSHADGCDPSHPVGFIEGWYVEPGFRRKGVGSLLVRAAEGWVRQQGCTEMASDTWIDHLISQRAHEALGFDIVDRCVHYRKRL